MRDDALGGWSAPDGYVIERPEYAPDCVMIGRKWAWVSVDLRHRCFDLGYAIPRRRLEKDKTHVFVGSDWKRRLLTAAVDHLRDKVGDI